MTTNQAVNNSPKRTARASRRWTGGATTPTSAAERRRYAEFIDARRAAEAASAFAQLKGKEGGRYPLTGVGDVNTYALFAETISRIVAAHGRAGFIVPTGVATDDSTKAYFAHIAHGGFELAFFSPGQARLSTELARGFPAAARAETSGRCRADEGGDRRAALAWQ